MITHKIKIVLLDKHSIVEGELINFKWDTLNYPPCFQAVPAISYYIGFNLNILAKVLDDLGIEHGKIPHFSAASKLQGAKINTGESDRWFEILRLTENCHTINDSKNGISGYMEFEII